MSPRSEVLNQTAGYLFGTPVRSLRPGRFADETDRFPIKSRRGHFSVVNRSAFVHLRVASWRAAPLRQGSRMPGPVSQPQGTRVRLFCGGLPRRYASVEPALVAEAHHLIDEDLLLLVVEARIKRLGGIRDIALIDGAVVEKLRLVAHLLDDVVRPGALGARDAQVQAVGAIMAEIVHRTVEPRPALLLLRRQLQFLLDPFDVGVAVGYHLLGGQRRLAILGQHSGLLARLLALRRLGGGLGRTRLFAAIRRRLLRRLIVAGAEHAGEDADHTADRAAEHAADRSRRLVAGLRALLDAFNQSLRLCARANKRQDNCPNRETQSELRQRGWCRAEHHSVSMVVPEIGVSSWS